MSKFRQLYITNSYITDNKYSININNNVVLKFVFNLKSLTKRPSINYLHLKIQMMV